MSSYLFPDKVFGECPVCGNGGGDAQLTSADAAVRDAAGNGYELFLYEGQYMCELCIKERKADDASLEEARRHAEEEQFRSKAGFKRRIT